MTNVILVPEAILEARTLSALRNAGADDRSAGAAAKAMMHASRIGVDSHGVRLTPHYVQELRSGRINPRPSIQVRRTGPASAILNADDGLGHAAAYEGMTLACKMAKDAGIAAVGIVHSSHYGAAGAYALAGAEAGLIALSLTNSDAIVALHGGAQPFHGTNPIAAAAPVPDQRPWLFDMATSSIPLNRVLLYRTLGRELPEGVAADTLGQRTMDPAAAQMLMPLGGTDFGFKGAGLAGLVTLLCTVLIGGTLDHLVRPMGVAGDLDSPHDIGHFCLAIDPDHFAGRAAYDAAIVRYLADLRKSTARPGEVVMAPGDREWIVETERRISGIPVDYETADFLGIAREIA
jgi:LDH2 family malate/lactate/ureidoglycolate dehydrogenase